MKKVSVQELTSNPELLAKLRSSASITQSSDEIRQQRISFIYGSMHHKNGVTKSHIEEVLANIEGK